MEVELLPYSLPGRFWVQITEPVFQSKQVFQVQDQTSRQGWLKVLKFSLIRFEYNLFILWRDNNEPFECLKLDI